MLDAKVSVHQDTTSTRPNDHQALHHDLMNSPISCLSYISKDKKAKIKCSSNLYNNQQGQTPIPSSLLEDPNGVSTTM